MRAHPTLQDVRAALVRIRGITVETPVVPFRVAGAGEILLKLESEQPTGSFKVRGAANALLQVPPEDLRRGVVAVSSGNHGRAVAHVARHLGVEAAICLSARVPPVKVAAIESLGATVVIAGADQQAAEAAARTIVEDEGRWFVHPFDDPHVIAGQGTIGLEILGQVPDVDTVVIPLSGGGLAGGIAVAVASARPGVRLIGVSQDRGPAMIESIRAGRLVDVVEEDTLADALAGGLGAKNHHSFALCRDLLDDLAVVSEEQIGVAMLALDRGGHVVEGGGAVGVAALLAGRIEPGEQTVVVVSGRNVAPETLDRLRATTA